MGFLCASKVVGLYFVLHQYIVSYIVIASFQTYIVINIFGYIALLYS